MALTREYLKSLNLEEVAVDGIMTAHGKAITAEQTKYTSLENQVTNLNEQLQGRDRDIKDLKNQNKDNDELKTKFDELQTKYGNQKTEHEQAITDLQLTTAIKLAVSDKAHDVDLVSGLVDRTKLSLKDGTISGLDEQVTALQECKAFLFKETDVQTQLQVRGIKPGTSNTGAPTDITYQDRLVEARKSGNSLEAIKIIEEAATQGQVLI